VRRASAGWWGALVSGADAAIGISAALGPNRKVVIPPGQYTLRSTRAVPCCAFNRTGVLISGINNFDLEAYGAQLMMADGSNYATTIMINQSNSWSMRGLTCVGNHNGIASNQEVSCYALLNVIGFTVRDITVTGNWGGLGAIANGDWMVNGIIDGANATKTGMCYDFAFMKGVSIANTKAVGADNSGNQGPGQIGYKCFSNVYDTPNAGKNMTGIAYTDTDGVTIGPGNEASNFGSGWLIASGRNYNLIGNKWHNNPGVAGAAGGVGGLIQYINGGPFSSVDHPPSSITVKRDIYANNGAAQAGAGILIGAAAITNNDAIVGISVHATFINNKIQGIEADTAKHIGKVGVAGIFAGSAQTYAVGGNLSAITKLTTYGAPIRSAAPTKYTVSRRAH
jgi:hypothetical protein